LGELNIGGKPWIVEICNWGGIAVLNVTNKRTAVQIYRVLIAVNVKTTAFWDTASCNLEEVHRHFRGAYCLHHQGDQVSIIIALMMEAVSTSEMLVNFYETGWCNIPEGCLHCHHEAETHTYMYFRLLIVYTS
jgi:hypothetical protein